jgi:hypothetical protein
VFFGNKCHDSIKIGVKSSMEVANEVLRDCYLGMPTEIARAATSSFKFLSERVWRCVTSVAGRPLSRAGKEVWLKSVARSIPNHVMSCFWIPTVGDMPKRQ